MNQLEKIANRLRILSIQATTAAGSGHPTSCCSAAELVATLFFGHMRFDPRKPRDPANDRFVLSKGHAAPLLYAVWAELGHFPESELLKLRRLDSDLEGHPTARLDFVDVATGSLGQGLSAGAGMALNGKLQGAGYRVYVLLGDGELAEGSVWEAANFASVQKLSNLIAILDVNRLGQNGPTAFGHDLDVYRRRFESFGWKALILDGHSVEQIQEALKKVGSEEQGDHPLVLIARTMKGKGIPGVEDQQNWHGKPLSKELAEKTIRELMPLSQSASGIRIPAPSVTIGPEAIRAEEFPQPSYQGGQKVATRKAAGAALVRIGCGNPDLMVLDGDVGNSTYTDEFRDCYPERFVECYISEQNMVGVAIGLSKMGRIPVCATFGTFFTRALDQIRMAAPSLANIKLIGTHNGVSIGEDGGSQMGLEDVAVMRAVEGSTVLSPCDAVSTERLVEEMIKHPGITYLRTARPARPVLYSLEEKFTIGGSKILRQSDRDQVTIVASGVSVFEAISAWEKLALDGIHVTVIDAYSIKPLAAEVIAAAARKTGGLVLTVEDHYPEGGLGEAVAGELSGEGVRVHRLAINELPHSGTERELLHKYWIDDEGIVGEVRALVAKGRTQAA